MGQYLLDSRQTYQCKILIIGRGLAGLATSIALRLASHNVAILERMQALSEVK